MKKIVTLVLAIALVLTSVVAIAESHATPNINTFAKMTTKYNETSRVYTIKLSKNVKKLWVLWAEKGAEPEELAVDENGEATAIGTHHKYMPGITQTIDKSVAKRTVTIKQIDDDAATSEDEFGWYQSIGATNGKGVILRTTTYGPAWTLDEDDVLFDADGNIIWSDTALWVYNYGLTAAAEGFSFDDIEVVEPQLLMKTITTKDKWGYTVEKEVPVYDEDGNYVVIPGYIRGKSVSEEVNKKVETNKATLYDAAFATLEGDENNDWLVYRNRKGGIVGIEYYEGQI